MRVYWQNNVVKLTKIHICDLIPKQCFDFDQRKISIKYSILEWFIHAALVFASHELLTFKTAINKTFFFMIPVNQQL